MALGKIFRGGKKRAQPISAEYSDDKDIPVEIEKGGKKKKKEVVDSDPMKSLKKKG